MEEGEYLDEGDGRVLVRMLKSALDFEPKERASYGVGAIGDVAC